MLLIPVSVGEVIDKITILEIKKERIKKPEALENIHYELSQLVGKVDIDDVQYQLLKKVNEELWDVEDELRILETKTDFGERFVSLARSVYKLNDERAAIKRTINLKYNSSIIEEKSY
jgi:hypothetical protein